MTGSFSEESLAKFAALANQTQAADFAEGEDTYDFTRCVRPDGSFYGTRGKCRKGSETGAKEMPAPAPRAAAKPKPKGGLGTKPETPEEKAQLRAEVNKLGRKPSQLKPEEKAAAAKRRGGPHASALAEAKTAWKDQAAVVKERKAELDRLIRAFKLADKEVRKNRTKETVARFKLVQRALAQQERAHANAERELLKIQRQTGRLAQRNERAKMTPAQLKQAREMDRRIREMG